MQPQNIKRGVPEIVSFRTFVSHNSHVISLIASVPYQYALLVYSPMVLVSQFPVKISKISACDYTKLSRMGKRFTANKLALNLDGNCDNMCNINN
jgi:hypothetical protein